MAFRRSWRPPIPESVKRKRQQKEAEREAEFQRDVVGPLMDLPLVDENPELTAELLSEEGQKADEEAAAAIARCICPKKGCSVHP